MALGETLLWCQLKKKQMLGFDFDRQHPVDEFIIDFYCKELKLAIEIDGVSHDIPKISENDQRRQKRIENFGIHFLRFSEQEVRSNMESVLFVIRHYIEQHVSSKPTPSRLRRATPPQEGI